MDPIKVVNCIWIGNPMHTLHYIALRHNIVECENAGWKLQLWTDKYENIPGDLRKYTQLLPQHLLALESHPAARTPAGTKVRLPHMVDLIRYHLLLETGGAYLDCDDFLLTSPDEIFDTSKVNWLMESKYCITNSLIYVPNTNNDQIRGILDLIGDPTYDTEEWASTGPTAVTEYMYRKYFKFNSLVAVIEIGLNRKLDVKEYASGIRAPNLYEVMLNGLYPIHLITESEGTPIKWTRFFKMIERGEEFDMQKYKREGFKMCGLFGSQVGAGKFNGDPTYVSFSTNTGQYHFALGDRGVMKIHQDGSIGYNI